MSSPASTPSAEDVDPAGIRDLLDALERSPDIRPRGVIVHRNGRRIAEGYWAPHRAADRPLVYSLSKSFTSAALGLAVDEGLIGLDETVAEALPERVAGAAPESLRIRVRHLASMSSGYAREMLLPALARNPLDPIRGLLSYPPEHEPGSWFQYNQPPFYALAVAIQQRAGMPLTRYLRTRITEPLGLPTLVSQQYGDDLDLGFSGMHTTLDAVAELGQLHLDDGLRGTRRLLPEGWVAQASSRQIGTPREDKVDWRQGYGFGLWMARHGYRGDGAFGQFMIVLPEQDAVVAIFSETLDMQAVVDAVWENLLPAVGRAPRSDDASLAERLAALAIPTAVERTAGSAAPALRAALTRDGGDARDDLSTLELDGDRLALVQAGERLELPLGRDGWAADAEVPFAVSSAAVADGVEIDVVVLEAPHTLRILALPSRGTFAASWLTAPLDPPRAGDTIAAMRSPA